jgi:hypothetical protein
MEASGDWMRFNELIKAHKGFPSDAGYMLDRDSLPIDFRNPI